MRRICSNLSLLVLFVCSTNVYGQYNNTKQIDSVIKVADKTDNIEQAIKLGISASDCAKKINYEDGIVEGLILAALKCYNAGRNEDVLKFTAQAENSVSEISNRSYLAQLMTLKGMSYTNLGFYKEGKQILNAALPVASSIPDIDARHSRLGSIYSALAQNNEDAKGALDTSLLFAKKNYTECTKINKKSRFAPSLALATDNVGVGFLEIKKYDSAEVYLNKAVLLASKYKEITVEAFANADLGDVYYHKSNYLHSKHCYYKAEAMAKELGNAADLKDIYTGLSKDYTALNDEKSARELLDSSMKLTDSLNKSDKAAIKTPLSYIIQADEKKTSQSIIQLVIILTGILVSFIVAICSLIFFSDKYKKQLKISKEKMNELAKEVIATTTQRSIDCLREIVQLAMDNNPLFLAKFNELFPEFNKKLLNLAPNLIASEIEICILLRINFDTKEIARYTKSSVRSVEGKKRRIRKKLEIPSNADINVWIAGV